MKTSMFYDASPLIFERAKHLRIHMTAAEIKLWGYLRTKPNNYKFRRQHAIGCYIADFYCHALRLVIEIDGGVHNNPDNKVHDEQRTAVMEGEGIQVIRFSNEQVLHQYEETIYAIMRLLPATYPPNSLKGELIPEGCKER